MKLSSSILFCLVAPLITAQSYSDGCNSALDSFNRLKESFYTNAEKLDFHLAYSSLVTATRNCPEFGELWYYRSVLGNKGGASKTDIAYSLRKARELGWNKSEGSPTAVSDAALPAQIGSKWALVVGVGKFQDSKLSELDYPASDATAFRDALLDKNVGRFSRENIKLLTDEKATLASIRETIGWLRENAKPEDLVVVYLASHGLSRDKDPNYVSYIAVHDSVLKNAATRYATSIQMIDLVNTLTRELQALRVVLILDTCFSGDAASASGEVAVSTVNVSQMASFGESLRLFQSGAGRAVLTAAQADQESYESDKFRHGYFTHFLIKALQESSGRITVRELYDRVKTSTEQAVKQDLGKDQVPKMIAGAAANDIVLGTAGTN